MTERLQDALKELDITSTARRDGTSDLFELSTQRWRVKIRKGEDCGRSRRVEISVFREPDQCRPKTVDIVYEAIRHTLSGETPYFDVCNDLRWNPHEPMVAIRYQHFRNVAAEMRYLLTRDEFTRLEACSHTINGGNNNDQ